MIGIGFYIALRVILVFRRLVRLGMGIFVDLVLVNMILYLWLKSFGLGRLSLMIVSLTIFTI
jgi:hypothetical protein